MPCPGPKRIATFQKNTEGMNERGETKYWCPKFMCQCKQWGKEEKEKPLSCRL